MCRDSDNNMLGSRDWLLRRIEYSINIAETELDLSDKKIKELPPEIGSLRGLSILDLSDNYLTELPPEIGNLQHLASLNLSHNRLSTLLPELGQLSILRLLYLSNLLLTKLPSQIGQLRSLHTLDLSKNLLVTLPSEIVNLQNLRDLNLSQNHLSKLPPEIGSLRGLSILDLSDNYLTELPPEIGKLQNLHTLDLDGNSDLVSPPPSIVKQGMEAVLAYLRGLLISRTPVWQSKLLIVGEGGVGKTSLINNFTGKPYKPDENRTHGIDIDKIVLPHPEFDDVEMILNVWDFAGQTIEHATHRFFYSNRSLFLVVWNARLGYQQGKIPYWLDRINALAPESPILIVATHIDQNAPDIPLDELQLQYPQVKGQVAISNKTKEGILDLGEQIRQHAVSLPLMGELWPSTWLEVAERIRDIDAIYASPSELVDIALEGQLSETDALTLLTWMHELGDILYFSDVPELKDIVILNPQWVSERVSDVLHDSDIIATDGIFTREQMNITWKNIPQYMHQILLQFMERFDLSYIIPNDPDKKSLIVERLQHTPPEYYAIWQSLADQPELTMRFRIPESTMPAGIPTWFIARQHRFTTGNHWRTGVLFEKDDHWALVRAFPENRYVELSVRGPVPSNFFSLLRDGLDLTFNRFPGLNVKRLIPCPGHNGKPCSHEFLFEAVQRALELGRVSLECQKELLQVPVLELAYGVRITDKQYQEILDRLDGIDKVAKDTNRRVQDLELLQRSFTQEYRNDQENVDIRCPNVISIFPDRNQSDIKKLINRKMNLQLYCQHPGHWHLPINEHGRIIGHYPLNMPAGIMEQLSPILNKAIPLLKFAVPIAAPTIALLDVTYYEDEAKRRLDFTKALVNELKSIVSPKNTLDSVGYGYKETIKGSNLRVLRQLLEELDVTRVWGGLNYVRTPEGHSLWLCDEHAAHY